MVLYSEEVDSTTMAAFYPVNALRNRALAQAKTEVPSIAFSIRTLLFWSS
jgi:hypothetical protein